MREQKFHRFGWDIVPFFCPVRGWGIGSQGMPDYSRWLQDDFINRECYLSGARGLKDV